MKKYTLIILMLLTMTGSAFANTIELQSEKGFFEFESTSDGLEFSLNSSNNKSGVCNIDGVAVQLNNPSNKEIIYVWSVPAGDSQCTMTIVFISDEHAEISTSQACNNFCGLDAAGSIDGQYVK